MGPLRPRLKSVFAVLVLILLTGRAEAAEPPSHYERAVEALNQQDWNMAVSELMQAIEAEPSNPMPYRARGLAYLKLSKYYLGIVDLTKALELDPAPATPYRNRALCFFNMKDYPRAIADLEQAMCREPQDHLNYAYRSLAFCRQDKYAEAVADIDEAIRLKPECPEFYELRAAYGLLQGDLDRATADLEAAMQRNPDDPAIHFEPWPKTEVTATDLEHGQRQLQQMLRDRPAMAHYGEQAEAVYRWAIRKFAGEDLGQRIYWDSIDPPDGIGAANFVQPGKPGVICIAPTVSGPLGSDESSLCECQWSKLTFEFYNTLNVADFHRLGEEAGTQKISKGEYTTQILQYESHAAEKTRAYFIHAFLPWAREHHVAVHPGLWFVGGRIYPEDSLFPGDSPQANCLRNLYAVQYDWHVLRNLVQQGQYEEALDWVEKMERQAPTPEYTIVIYRMRGCCQLMAGHPAKAVLMFDEAIRIAPTDPEPYLCRAGAYLALQELRQAQANCEEAIHLDPSEARAYRLRSAVYAAQGDQANAAIDTAKAESLMRPGGLDSEINGVPIEWLLPRQAAASR